MAKNDCPKCGQSWAVHNGDGSCVEDGDTVRAVLEGRLREALQAHGAIDPGHIEDLVRELADQACSALGISEKEQREAW